MANQTSGIVPDDDDGDWGAGIIASFVIAILAFLLGATALILVLVLWKKAGQNAGNMTATGSHNPNKISDAPDI